jgi:hypothetical protein
MRRRLMVLLLATAVAALLGALLLMMGRPTIVTGYAPRESMGPGIAHTSTSRVWEPVTPPTGVLTYHVSSLAVDPHDAHRILLSAHVPPGLYRSEDAGQTWTAVTTGHFGYVSQVLMAPSQPQRLYVQAWELYRSDDDGATWALLGSAPRNCGLAVAPSDPDRLYARRCYGQEGPAVYSSIDGGQSWISPTTTFTPTLHTLVVAPDDSQVLVAANFDSVFRSPDGGATWQRVPVGVRYASQPYFDPEPPHMLYLGHWRGLLRSSDAGLSWEASGVDREFATVTASPLGTGEVLGGNQSSAWRVSSAGSDWRASTWDAPLPLESLWRSATDSSVVYARSNGELWRTMYRHRVWRSAVYLPLIHRTESVTASPPAAQTALDRVNLYRARVGAVPLQLHPAIITAAQAHADYHMLNHSDPSAWEHGAHGEVEGKPGYTGRWPGDRMRAAGYPWFGGSEVMHYLGDPVASVDDWMATIYHRVIPLGPHHYYMGYGYGRSSQTRVDVMNFGTGPRESGIWSPAIPYPLAYPADDQTDVPVSWWGGESPDPLPPGAAKPVGYPFTLQGVGGTLRVDIIEMRNASGHLVAVHPNPPDCPAFNCFALIAVSPLQPNTTYIITARGVVGTVAFDQSWTFTTTGTTNGVSVYPKERWIGPAFR